MDPKPRIDINCDMGEGMSNDAALMPYISSANVACGFHAGDRDSMQKTIELCLQHGVAIGAHPGFPDRENFGRTEMQLPDEAIVSLITEQVQLLQDMALSMGTTVTHVKPHGALYNMAARDMRLAGIIAQTVYQINPRLVLFGLSGSFSISTAASIGLIVASEVFADRTYQDDGSLTPRSHDNALLNTTEDSCKQVLQMILEKTVQSVTGKKVPIQADTICIHGDGKHALSFAQSIHALLGHHSIQIQPFHP
jgi:UPF0271 protein